MTKAHLLSFLMIIGSSTGEKIPMFVIAAIGYKNDKVKSRQVHLTLRRGMLGLHAPFTTEVDKTALKSHCNNNQVRSQNII